jgi:CRISPR-associated Csx2 family protein
MTHTLISFLGKVPKKDGEQYRESNYDFKNDIHTSRFFGKALKEVIKPDKIILLGTSGSMWDVLVESMGATEEQYNERDGLIDAVKTNQVTQSQLNFFEKVVSDFLQVSCLLKLIPYGVDENEQVEILQKMAEEIQEHDEVTLDLTHGLRHLPMLGLLSAMYLKITRGIEIKAIYYGAGELTDPETKKTPVIRLDGLLKITDWLHALDGFNKTGNLMPFSELLQRDGANVKTAHCLEEAAFFENTLNIAQARRPLKEFTEATKKGLNGISALFEKSLQERIAWHKQDNLYLRQRENAYFYLKQGDYLRAACLGYEALITRQVQQGNYIPKLDPQNFRHREKVQSDMDKNTDFRQLNYLRNSLAHGTRSTTDETQRALSSKEKLQSELNRLFIKLLPV